MLEKGDKLFWNGGSPRPIESELRRQFSDNLGNLAY